MADKKPPTSGYDIQALIAIVKATQPFANARETATYDSPLFTISEWLRANEILVGSKKVMGSVLYQHYSEWAKRTNLKEPADKFNFGRYVKKIIPGKRTKVGIIYNINKELSLENEITQKPKK